MGSIPSVAYVLMNRFNIGVVWWPLGKCWFYGRCLKYAMEYRDVVEGAERSLGTASNFKC